MPGPWKDARGITVTTTPTIEGHPIQEYCGHRHRRGDCRRQPVPRSVRQYPRHCWRAVGAVTNASFRTHASRLSRNCRPKRLRLAAMRWSGSTLITR